MKGRSCLRKQLVARGGTPEDGYHVGEVRVVSLDRAGCGGVQRLAQVWLQTTTLASFSATSRWPALWHPSRHIFSVSLFPELVLSGKANLICALRRIWRERTQRPVDGAVEQNTRPIIGILSQVVKVRMHCRLVFVVHHAHRIEHELIPVLYSLRVTGQILHTSPLRTLNLWR